MIGSHSFVAPFVEESGVGLVWLDSQKQRFMPAGGGHEQHWMGAIGLRYTAIDTSGALRGDQFLDEITCDCCPNAAVNTASGPVVAYRDRVAPAGMKPEDVTANTATVRDVTCQAARKWSMDRGGARACRRVGDQCLS